MPKHGMEIFTEKFWGADDEEKSRLIEEYQDLLANFGADVLSLCPGVVISIPVGENGQEMTIPLSTVGWNWIRPLLVELVKLRNEGDGAWKKS